MVKAGCFVKQKPWATIHLSECCDIACVCMLLIVRQAGLWWNVPATAQALTDHGKEAEKLRDRENRHSRYLPDGDRRERRHRAQ